MNLRSLALVPVLAIALLGLAACGGAKSAAQNAANSAGNAANGMTNGATNAMGNATANMRVPNCGAVKAVWVNLNSKAYHEPGDPYYGKTKHGEYLCPSAAKAQGFHPAGGSAMTNQSSQESGGRHHRRHGGGAPMGESTP